MKAIRKPWSTVAITGFALILGAAYAPAQNAAQRAALAKISHPQSSVQPQGTTINNSQASNAGLDLPKGLAFDTAGDLFIADTANHIIREVNLLGIISTVAGTGDQGFGGDGGPATSALLDSPYGVAVDASGNLYIADTHNNRIREVSNGTITTIAGTGVAGFSGDGAAATAAMLNMPSAIALDSNANVYFTDANNNRVREIVGTTINTVAGNGTQTFSGDGGLATAAGLDSPFGVAVDSAFNIYISDTHNQRVRMVTYSTGIITTLAGNGTAGFSSDGTGASAELARPLGITVDASGIVYFADSDNNRIRTISGGQVATIAGNGQQGYSGNSGPSTSASLNTPNTVAVHGGSLAVADTQNQTVRTVSANGINTTAGKPSSQNESLLLSGSNPAVYGSGSLTLSFSNGTNVATGQITFFDGQGANPANLGSVALTANTAILNTGQLAVGTHYIVANYVGDTNNPAIASGIFVLQVTPFQLTAVANSVNLSYGQPIPALTGTLLGVLPQDAGNVTASFTSTATPTSAPGSYPITATLSGLAASNYSVVMGAGPLGSGLGSVSVGLAATQVALSSGSSLPVLGASYTLTATVTSTTAGTPTGTVSFYDGTTLLNTVPATISGGVASFSLSTLALGAHSLTAVYSGDSNFLGSTSTALAPTFLAADFTVAVTPSAQTVLPGHSVSYTLTLTPQNSTFVSPVALSVTGLPAGVTAAFSPASIAAGAAASSPVLTLSASDQAHLTPLSHALAPTAFALLLLPLAFTRRARLYSKMLLALLMLAGLTGLAGCGGFFNHPNQSYTVTITAVSGSITHTANVTLTVQ